MEVSVEVDKIIKCAIYNTVFFSSGGGADDVLVRLSLFKKLSRMSILCAFHSVSNIHRYLGVVNEFVQYV